MNPAAIEALIQLGLNVFIQVFSLFKNQGVPTTSAQAITTHLTTTPGMTPAHMAVVTSAVNTAAAVSDSMAK
jgi:hypothetical protein